MNMLKAAGIEEPYFIPSIIFTQDQIAGVEAVVGAEIWGCISDACSFGGSAQLDFNLVCIKQGLINYLQPLLKEFGGIDEDGLSLLHKIVANLFRPVY